MKSHTSKALFFTALPPSEALLHIKVQSIVYSKVYKKHISLFIVGAIGSIDNLIENHAKIIHLPNDRYNE